MFFKKVLSQNSVENDCVGVLSCRREICHFIKKEIPTQCFSVNFGKCLRSLFYRTTPMIAFETIYLNNLFRCRNHEAQINSRVLPFRKQNKVNLK